MIFAHNPVRAHIALSENSRGVTQLDNTTIVMSFLLLSSSFLSLFFSFSSFPPFFFLRACGLALRAIKNETSTCIGYLPPGAGT